MENDNIPTNEYINRLWQQPEGYHSSTSWADLNSLMWDSKDIMGDCFLSISTDENYNIVNGFKYIHNSEIMYHTDTDVYGLVRNPNIVFEPNELIHIREPDILLENLPWGVSKAHRAAPFIALFMNAIRYNNFVLNNDGLDPNTFVMYDKDMDNLTFKQEIQRLKILKEQQKKERKQRSLIALKGATITTANNSNKDMQYLELLNYSEDGIIRTFGIPPQLYGKIDTANLGSGSGDSQKKDWKITFEGETCYIENAFNNSLRNYGFSERFHYQQMDVIDELYDAQVNQIYLNTGVLTRDEVRNNLGLDKLSTNNVWDGYFI